MSRIDLSQEIKSNKTGKNMMRDPNFKKPLIILLLLCLLFGTIIIFIISKFVDLPFKTGNRNTSEVVKDSVNIIQDKIEEVKKSFLIIRPNSFWDHRNYTDIDYSNKIIGLAVNKVLGYDQKKQEWFYRTAEDRVSEIVSAVGKLTLDDTKYEAEIQFNIVGNFVYFYDLHLKEEGRGDRFMSATPRQKSLLIEMMYRGH